MKKILLIFVFGLLFLNALGCTSRIESLSSYGLFGAATSSCDKPPKVLEWSGKSYRLITENTTSEAGMKYGFMKCDKGKFTLGDASDAFVVYSVGNPTATSY